MYVFLPEIVKIVKYTLGFLFVLIIIIGCQEDDPTAAKNEILESIYFPLNEGLSNEYIITKYIIVDNGASVDTSIYYLREVIVDEFVDFSNITTKIIDQYERATLNAPWVYKKSVNSTISENQAQRSDGNFKFVKLQLPIDLDKEWNPNQYFDTEIDLLVGGQNIEYYKNWTAKYISQEESLEVNNVVYQNIVTVEIANHENRLELRRGIERYAENIGLIYRKIEVFDTQCFDDCSEIPWLEKAEKGEMIVQEILNQN